MSAPASVNGSFGVTDWSLKGRKYSFAELALPATTGHRPDRQDFQYAGIQRPRIATAAKAVPH
jgi:hypothetical protein